MFGELDVQLLSEAQPTVVSETYIEKGTKHAFFLTHTLIENDLRIAITALVLANTVFFGTGLHLIKIITFSSFIKEIPLKTSIIRAI